MIPESTQKVNLLRYRDTSSAALTPPSHTGKLLLTSQLPGRPVRQPLNNADRLPVHSAARHERTTLEHPQDQSGVGVEVCPVGCGGVGVGRGAFPEDA
jgi:hypothetical protein